MSYQGQREVRIAQAPAEKRVFFNDEWTSGRVRSLRPARKGIVYMKDIIRKFTSPVQTDIVSCAVTFVTEKACMLLLVIVILLDAKLKLAI